MIRFVTIRNVALLDAQFEKAWRRRCDAVSDCLDEMDDDALLRALCDRRKRIEKSQEWLRRLAIEMEALAGKKMKAPGRRRRFETSGRSAKGAVSGDRGGRRETAS